MFPNSHVHKVTKLENVKNISSESVDIDINNTYYVQKRPIVVFFLANNPEKRIVSTREVPPQQSDVGGMMSHEEDSMEHRLELMKEREKIKAGLEYM